MEKQTTKLLIIWKKAFLNSTQLNCTSLGLQQNQQALFEKICTTNVSITTTTTIVPYTIILRSRIPKPGSFIQPQTFF